MKQPLVWIVEDADLVRLLIEDILSENDFPVHSFRSARHAIACLGESHAIPSILITDISFGADTITGWDLARSARRISADIATIYISGYFDGETPDDAVPEGIFLRKPFTRTQLISAISDLRGDRPTRGSSPGAFPSG